VLYLVNAAEHPADAGYVAMEMQILTWIGKPVVLLLNQMGPPRSAADESAEADRWRVHVKPFPVVRDVLALDAFARCWVQEEALIATVGKLIAPEKQPAFESVASAWREKNLTRFHRAMELLASQLGRALVDREVLGTRTLRQQAREFIRSLGIAAGVEPTDKERAMAALAERLDENIRATTDALIALHALDGHAAAEVLRRMQEDYAASEPFSEGRAAVWGGIASGALAGLKADLAAGGLTFGAGLVGGAIVGALGAAGLARGYNFVRGQEQAAVRWSAEFVVGLTRSALLRYLAVAHFGRGRGDFVESEHPRFWQSAVAAAVEPHRDEIHAIWDRSIAHMTHAQASSAIESVIAAAAVRVLDALYPNQRALLQASVACAP
jgi:hypothetical protein